MNAETAHPIKGSPKQKRSRRTRQRLVRAATRLFSEKGYEKTTTNQIARRARVSVGTFYKYFVDKHEIFLEIFRNYSLEIEKTILKELEPQKWEGVDFYTGILSLVKTAFQSHKHDPGLQRAFAHIAMKDAEFQEARNQIRALLRAPLERLIENRGSEIKMRNIPLAAFLIDEAVEACLHGSMMLETPFAEEEMIEELAKMCTGYLTYSGTNRC
jgi:AcrR family transcriptional regulator